MNAKCLGRQFKEASRLASESKAMSLAVEQAQESLSEAEKAMVTSSKALSQLSDDLGRGREALSQLERIEGLSLISG